MSDTKKPSHEKFEADFEAFLRDEDSHLAGLYRKLPQPEPDASIDVRLRARARQALRESDAQTEEAAAIARRRRPGWLPALGAAATFVAVAGVAWRLMPHTAPLPTTATATNGALVTAAAPAKTGDTESSAAAPVPQEVSPATQAADQAAEAPAQQASPTIESAQYRHKVRRSVESAPIAPPPAAAAPGNKASVAADRLPAPAVAAPLAKPESPAAFPRRAAQAQAENAPQSTSTLAAPPPPTAAAKAAAPATMESARAATTAGYAPAQPSSVPAPAAARQQAPGNRLADTEAASAGGAVQSAPLASIEPDPSVPGRYRWQIAGVAAETATKHNGIYPPDPPPPAVWVDIIHAMLRDGHPDAARRALADLRRRHPDFRVPADLRGIE